MDNELELRDYIGMVKRRTWLLILPFLLVLAVSSGVVMGLPAIYRSTAIILVESQQIPQDLVRSTITAFTDERIAMIRQRVMTRANLMGIIDKYALFADVRATASPDDLLDLLREQIFIELIVPDTPPRRNRDATVAFELSFEEKDPELAAELAEELTTLFLAENVKSRTERAIETTEFLMQEAQNLRKALDAMEDRVAAYKQENSDALPEHLDLHLEMLDRADTELNELNRDIEALEEERNTLEVEILSAAAGTLPTQPGAVLSPAEQLAAFKTEFIEKSAIYGAAHPDVRNLTRQIAALEREVDIPVMGRNLAAELDAVRAELAVAREGQSANHPNVRRLDRRVAALEREIADIQRRDVESSSSSGPVDPVRALIQAKVSAADLRLDSLRIQKQKIQAKMEQLQAQVVRTPQVERGLAALNRDYENALVKYEEVKSKQLEAQLAERLEEEQKAERFVLLEPPTVPVEPVSPDRRKLLVMGFVLAIGAGGGAAFSAEMLDKTIHAPTVLAALAGTHPLAVIPYIETSSEQYRRKRRKRLLLILAALIVLLMIVLVHQFLVPLDVLVTSALEESSTQ